MHDLVALAAATGDTANLQAWIKDNIVPLLLLLIAVMLFVFAQRGDNAKAMRVVAGVVIALGVLGLATSGRAGEVGSWLASLVTG
jgi:membrane-bound ClpP family serine protease